jgi:parallel beta-helix repeat protein
VPLGRKAISAITLTLLLVGMFAVAFNIQTVNADSGTIYIRADGSIDPPTAPISTDDNVTYTFFENITSAMDGIVVQRNNILIDAKGCFLQESFPYFGTGFNLTGTVNVTIKNAVIRDFVYDIYLLFSSNNSISGNSMVGNYSRGIELQDSHGNSLSGNNVTELQGGGIYLDNSSNNVVEGNTIIALGDYAISLTNSSGNILRKNQVMGSIVGIKLHDCSGCLLSGNNATGNSEGIEFEYSSQNIVSGNSITKSGDGGVGFMSSHNNTLSGNNITDTQDYGITMYTSFGNSIFDNNLVNNGQNALSYQSLNVFDRDYPTGGNYWSDYSGIDVFSGRYQNETGSDGIGDAPYFIDSENTDRYPLMSLWVRLSGDVNGDRIVDIYDAILLANAYGSSPGKEKWNPDTDINGDNIVDIYDAILLANHFNQHSP